MAKNYRLENTSLDDTWEAFIRASNDSSIFTTANYLSHTGCRLGLYRCYNASELRALVAVVETADGTSAVLNDFVIYSGICFGAPTNAQNQAQQNSERHEITAFIATELANKYQRVEFALAPSIIDVRPFLWHNYGQEEGRYKVDVRYTSYLDIADFANSTSLDEIAAYRNSTGARRQQIRYAQRDGIVTEEFADVSLFIDFYRKTFERQAQEVQAHTLHQLETLVTALLNQGAARMFVSKTREGHAGSAAVYTFDHHRAYYLFGASDPDLRDSPTGTAILWDAFHQLSSQGITEIDLEGVNSPRRGWFKMSFGGDLRPYYEISKGVA